MPDFFQEVDDLGIVEQHIQRVLKLETSQSEKLLKRYREIRRDLGDRLNALPGNTFSAQQLRGVLVQVDGAIQAMNASLIDGMGDAALHVAMFGVEDQLKEIKAFSEHFKGAVVPINLNAQLVASDTRNFLLNRYQASIEAYGSDVRANLVQALTTESLMESPYSKITQKLGQFFAGEEWKLHRIARTELHNVYGQGKLNGMTEVKDGYLPDLKKALVQPMDSRTGKDSVYADSLELVAELDEPFKYRWKKQLRVFMAPPDRPNDRSILIPYRQAWNT